MAFKPFKTLLFGFAFSPSLKANVYEATRLAKEVEESPTPRLSKWQESWIVPLKPVI